MISLKTDKYIIKLFTIL